MIVPPARQLDGSADLNKSLPVDSAASGQRRCPLTIIDNGAGRRTSEHLRAGRMAVGRDPLTLNYGIRFDQFGVSGGNRVSHASTSSGNSAPSTTVHGGYSRYFSRRRSS